MKQKGEAVLRWLDRHALILGLLLGALLSAALAVYNVSGGPPSNLNDIGGWRNRMIFIVMTALVQMMVLTAAALMGPCSFARLALRQLLVTAGLFILLLAINHKSYLFVNQLLPFIRQMDAAGLSAIGEMQLNLSAPAATALYLLTRGPIYDMYTVKLACAACFLLLALLAARAADRRNWGLRSRASRPPARQTKPCRRRCSTPTCRWMPRAIRSNERVWKTRGKTSVQLQQK